MTTPHKHAELIKKWADGAVIEYRPRPVDQWRALAYIGWNGAGEYRVKPELESSMTGKEAYDIYAAAYGDQPSPYRMQQAMKAVADEAVRRYVKENTKSS